MIDKKQSSENRRILRIAIPSIISNITVPLLGLIDVTIVGHLGSPAYIGAIAVGGMLFNIIYWIFGFLRMGTSGMTSQAYGQHDLNEITRLLLRSVGVGLFIALCLLILQYPILKLAFTLIQTTPEVEQLATTTRLQKYGGKNALCLAEAATSLLLLLRKQAAYDDGHLQQFF